MFHFWLNTRFIENDYLCFERAVLDKACKDKKSKHFLPNFKVELFLHKVADDDRDFKLIGMDEEGKEEVPSDDDEGEN